MNIVFFGTSEFAIPSLKKLISSKHKVLAVVTQPDRKKGRDLKLSPPATKVLAESNGIRVYQPVDSSSKESAEYLKKLGAGLFVVVSFGQILKKDILSIPKYCAINLHGSLLPKYRGAAPTNWAIINGDKLSGVSVIRINERLDEGDIILSRKYPIDGEDTNITLTEALSALGADALLEAVEMIESGKANFEKQNGKEATYAPKLKKEDGLIDWSEPAASIHNKVRGFIPWPGAYTHYENKSLKILKTKLSGQAYDKKALPGEIIDIKAGEGVVVSAGSGYIAITHLQLEGKKPMDTDAYLRGHRMEKGGRFG